MPAILTLILLLFVAGGVFYYIKKGSQSSGGFTPVKLVPDVTLKTIEGGETKLSEFRGRPLIVNVWASWCPFCKKELTSFSELGGIYKDSLVIVAINRKESIETIQAYANKTASGTVLYLRDDKDEFYKSINGFSMPETLFVDSEGVIKLHRRGAIEPEEMKRRVSELYGL